jgi:ubiquinone/menaquinone biosynthesis C-methylase UbiE
MVLGSPRFFGLQGERGVRLDNMSASEPRHSLPSTEAAILALRRDVANATLLRDAYLDSDTLTAARRFAASVEFEEVLSILGPQVRNSRILDLGAGVGIASYAFARSGARRVYALEPDPSDVVGRGALGRLRQDVSILPFAAVGEKIPLQDESVDVVYCRQVLHHARDLFRLLTEAARILRPGGTLLATREHVTETDQDRERFLEQHPVHRLAGGENSYPLRTYADAIRRSGLRLRRIFAPWETVTNLFPEVRSVEELREFPRLMVRRRLGRASALMRVVPLLEALVWRRVRRPAPGAHYSFLATKAKG